MNTMARKACAACGTDVSQQKRVKDPRTASYFCHPCWAATQQPTHQPVAPFVAEDAPAEPDPLSALAAVAGTSAIRPSTRRMSQRSSSRTGRWVVVGVIAAVVVAGVGVFVVPAWRQADKQFKTAHDAEVQNGQRQVEMYRKMAVEDEKRSVQYGKEAAEAHAWAEHLRNAQGPTATSNVPLSQRVDDDVVIRNYCDRHPDLHGMFQRLDAKDTEYLRLQVQIEVGSGEMKMWEAQKIQKFIADNQNAPRN